MNPKYQLSIRPPTITNDDFISRLNLKPEDFDHWEGPLNAREWHEVDICPICKKSVKIYRHNKALCAHICKNEKDAVKATQRAIKIEKTKRRPKPILKETN